MAEGKGMDAATASVSRRAFVEGAVAAAASAGVATVACQAQAHAAQGSSEADDKDFSSATSADETVWGDAPRPVDDFDFAETLDADVVVVGAGTAGIPAAASAAQSGARVIVLEKMAAAFGIRTYVGAIGSSLQREKGVEIDEQQAVQELLRYSSYRADASLIRLWAENSGEAIDWYSDILQRGGMHPWLETDINEGGLFKEYSTCHMFYDEPGGSTDGTQVMLDKLDELGVEVRYSTPMVQLIQDDSGRVTGVVASDEDGRYLRVNASKGVVLATGGYAANTEMLKALNEKDILNCVMSYCDPGATGDGIRAAHWAGAQMDLTHTAMFFERAATMPGSDGGDWTTPTLWWMGSQPFLQVNRHGERFANESLPYDYDLHQDANQPGHVFVQVFDSNWADDVAAFHTIGCSRIVTEEQQQNGYEPVSWTPEKIEAATMEPALQGGQLQQADTIAELAEKMGMDPDTLQATIDRYNELCDAGSDDDFWKESYRMRPVRQAPFYAVTVGGQLLCTMDGVWIDTKLRVLDGEGRPVEGLYAVGNDSGRYFSDCYPELFVGAACGRSITFGYLVGKELAEA
ncbi:MAG: FAD-dependent oxidoreductase [Coriobacteriales bacterium]|jgi:fumarate reductase flavoprotein subunit